MGVLCGHGGTCQGLRGPAVLICVVRYLFAATLLLQVLLVHSSVRVLATTMPGVALQGDGVPTKTSYLHHDETLPDLDAFSLCFRVSFGQFRDVNPFISYAVEDNPHELYVGFNYQTENLVVECCDHLVRLTYNLGLPQLDVWYSGCVALSLNTGEWQLKWSSVQDYGTIDETQTIVRGGGQLFLGQRQSILGGGFSIGSSLRGSLVDVKLYDTDISEDDMNMFLECGNMDGLGDPLVNFLNIQEEFTSGDSGVDIIDVEDICLISQSFYMIFPEEFTFWEAETLCHISNGRLPQLESEEEILEVLQQVAPYSEVCAKEESVGSLWLGVLSDPSNEMWVNYGTQEQPFYEDVLDTSVPPSETCASLVTTGEETEVGKRQHTDCHDFRCMACKYESSQRTLWRLRGLCPKSPLDRTYVMLGGNTSIVIRGLFFSAIQLYTEDMDETHRYGYWKIMSYEDPKAAVKLYRNSPDHYPFGVNDWETENNMCGKKLLRLMLTKCNEDEMTCGDTSCLASKNYRCDMEVDCQDDSDEENCNKIKISKSYKSEISPPRKDLHNPLIVLFYIDVLSIKKFDISNFIFTTEVIVHFTWRDPRLKFLNLQSNSWKNKISTKIWEPSVEYLGGHKTSCDVKERRKSLFAVLEGEPLPEDEQEVLEERYYSGDSNNVSLEQQLTIETGCQFDLYAFPFDVQYCDLTIALQDIPDTVVHLEVTEPGVIFHGERYMLQYLLNHLEVFNHSLDEFSAVTLRLTFSNLSTYFISSTYVPTFLLLVVGYLTFYFPIDDFSDRIMVSLTALLVEAAFFTQTSENIPQTAYLKLVDIWFVFCIVSLFVIMLSLVTINTFEERNQRSEPQEQEDRPFYMNFKFEISPRIAPMTPSKTPSSSKCCCRKRRCSLALNLACQVVIPILIVIFLSVYFTMALDLVPQ